MLQEDETWEKIDRHRIAIDEIDGKLVALLNERQRHALAIRGLKPQAGLALFDAKREEEILQAAAASSTGPLYPDHVREIYSAILKVSKEVPSSDA